MLAHEQGISLSTAVRRVVQDDRNAQSVLRTAQRIRAATPGIDQMLDTIYAEADWHALVPAIIETAIGGLSADENAKAVRLRVRQPTWEGVDRVRVSTSSGPIDGRVEQRAVDIKEQRAKPPLIRYEWRVCEMRSRDRRGFKTTTFPSQAEAEHAFSIWAKARRLRRARQR